MDFFNDCTTQSARKERYRELAKVFHPDKCGSSTLMAELNKQYKDKGRTPQDSYNPMSSYTSYFTNIRDRSHDFELGALNLRLRDKDYKITELTAKLNETTQGLIATKSAFQILSEKNNSLEKEIGTYKDKLNLTAKAQVEAERKLQEKVNSGILDNIKNYFKGEDAKQS